MESSVLYLFSGLPGTGKTTLSQHLASEFKAFYIRIDTIEQALRVLCQIEVEGEGYRLAYRMATDNLRLGLSVVADSCNPDELTRREWEDVAKSLGKDFVNIEVICSDKIEHRRRVENRGCLIPDLVLPSWEQIITREYQPWSRTRVIVDTAGCSPEESFVELCALIQSRTLSGH